MTTSDRSDMDEHVHEHILSQKHVPDVDKKHRAKSKARAIALGMKPEVAEVLYGEPK